MEKAFHTLPSEAIANPPASNVWKILTNPENIHSLKAYSKFYDTYCIDTNDSTVISLTEHDTAVLAVSHCNGMHPNDHNAYTVIQYDTVNQIEQVWQVWHANDYSFERIGDSFERTLLVYSGASVAQIHLTQTGMFWEQNGETTLPSRCHSPIEIAYRLAQNI